MKIKVWILRQSTQLCEWNVQHVLFARRKQGAKDKSELGSRHKEIAPKNSAKRKNNYVN